MTDTKKKTFHWVVIGVGGGLIVLNLLSYVAVLSPAKRAFSAGKSQDEEVSKTLAGKRADVATLEAIQSHLKNASGAESIRFEKHLWDAGDGFSSLIQFFTDAASRTGVQKGRTVFKSPSQAEAGLLEVKIDLPLEGTYTDVVRFINALERSDHLLIIETIALQTGQDNPALLKLNLALLTYLKSI